MALPLPRVVPDVGPGGGMVTALRGSNALLNDIYGRQYNKVKAQYAPITAQADAASKMAYAQLMAPQYMAKLMGNPDIVANMTPDQRNAGLNMIYGAGKNSNNALLNMGQQSSQQESNPFSLKAMVDKIKNAFSFGDQQQAQPQQQAPQQMQMQMQQPMQPMPQQAQSQMPTAPMDANQQEIQAATDAWMKRPEVSAQAQRDGMYTIPDANQMVNWYRGQQAQQPSQSPNSWAENIATQKGIEEEGKELGKQRADAISEMDQQYQDAVQAGVPIDHLIEIAKSPQFANMRKDIPFFQDKQLSYLAKMGTPEQQKMIGDYIATSTSAVANTVNSFRGRILDKEITMANQMKVSPNDTWGVMQGKLASVKTFNEMTKQRARLTTKFMEKDHLNRGDALEKADSMVDGAAIRNKVEDDLQPMVTVKNRKTGETKTVPLKEARSLGLNV